MTFDAKKVKDEIVTWIRKWFDENGKNCNAIVGISGGKDSSVVASLCVEALGRNRVIGVLMPNGIQCDIDMAKKLVEHLEIQNITVNIKDAYDAIYGEIENAVGVVSNQTKINMPARIRMVTLYGISQSKNGRVANTCNLSEDWVGYATRYGDGAGDFSPISNLTVTEVKLIGKVLGVPDELIQKVPIDGLCGKSDEDNLGFTYDTLDKYIREGICTDQMIRAKIDTMHAENLFKMKLMPAYEYKVNK
jgi:NAD+ synthase